MDESKTSEIPKLQIMWQNKECNASLHWLYEKQKNLEEFQKYHQTLTQKQNTPLQHTLTISSLSLPPKTKKLTLTLTTATLTHIWKTRNKLQFDDTTIPATNVIINIKNWKTVILTHYNHHTINNTLHEFQSNFYINNALRRFYTRRNVSGMWLRYRFFCSCTCVKVFFTNTLLKCRFRWKVGIISTLPLRANVTFFLIQSFFSIHVNKVSHYNMAYSQSTI